MKSRYKGLLLSADLQNEPDILMLNGASAALLCSDIPWNGPIGAIRLALVDDEYIVNPTHAQMFESELDLIYVGNEKEMMMIEGSAEEIPDDKFIEALEFAQKAIQPIIKAQRELAKNGRQGKAHFRTLRSHAGEPRLHPRNRGRNAWPKPSSRK